MQAWYRTGIKLRKIWGVDLVLSVPLCLASLAVANKTGSCQLSYCLKQSAVYCIKQAAVVPPNTGSCHSAHCPPLNEEAGTCLKQRQQGRQGRGDS